MKHIIAVKFFSNMGYSEETVEKVIRKCGPSTQPFLLLEEIEKKNQRLQGHRELVPHALCVQMLLRAEAQVLGAAQ